MTTEYNDLSDDQLRPFLRTLHAVLSARNQNVADRILTAAKVTAPCEGPDNDTVWYLLKLELPATEYAVIDPSTRERVEKVINKTLNEITGIRGYFFSAARIFPALVDDREKWDGEIVQVREIAKLPEAVESSFYDDEDIVS
jgi:hypothetical protein